MTPEPPVSATPRGPLSKALIVGLAALGVLAVTAFLDRQEFFRAYLLGWLFFTGLALGCLALQLLHNLTGGGWGFAIKPVLRAGTRTLLPMAALFLPLCLGIHSLYEWSHADAVAADPVLQHKAPYLNTPFFLTRSAFYLVSWILVAWWTGQIWKRYQQQPSFEHGRTLRRFSAAGLAFYCLTMSFASFDWAMSLEPHWFSTIYGMHFIVGQALGVLCLSVVTLNALMKRPDFQRLVQTSHFHDLGNLLLAFTMLWAYVSFSQYLIIWSGNLPEETPWYLRRSHGLWQAVALALVVFHFAVPFLILLNRRVKRSRERLASLAGLLLALRLVDLVWVVVPGFGAGYGALHWSQGLAVVGFGGVWLHVFRRQLARTETLMERDGELVHSYAVRTPS